ncbi:MAG TPA: hypothetical protein VLD63_13015 [Anaerolineales bacterium]|nr:hypothetical protein [Anaerolineales bacterium]
MTRFRSIAFVVAGSLAGGLVLAWLDGKGFSLAGSLGYAVLLALSLAAIVWTHRSVSGNEPMRAALVLAVGAMVLRLAVGLALARALPVYGYAENPQKAGYVFWDSYKRDADAWQRARGDLPLLSAFTSPKVSDQYGGLLFVSAASYRYLSGGVQRPLMVVVLTAAASALGVLFIGGLARVRWDPAAAAAAAWIAALFPESVLLGASQMREPFLIAGLAISLYGYVLSRERRTAGGIAWLVGGLLVLLFFSPPTALAGAAVIGLLAVWEGRERPRIPRWVWWLGIPFALAGLLLAIRSWARLEEISGTFGQVLLQWWQNAGASWRVGQAAAGSDMLQVMLDRLPSALRLPFLIAYGLVQPFLPAAIAAPGNTLWKTIAILRSLGWFAVIPALIYGTVAAIRRMGWRSLEAYLGILIWVTALLASYRAPGYQWDNPRYRTVFLAAQAGLVAWAWLSARITRDRWLGRAYICLCIATAIVLYWYLGRYAGLPGLSLEATMAAAVLGVGGYAAACILADRRARPAQAAGTGRADV